MSEMIERVALAIQTAMFENSPAPPPEDLRVARILGRAAIEAMRELNVDMLDSACAAWVKLYPAFEGEKPQPKAGEVATTIFNAMIDAALTPARVDEAG